MTSLNSATTAKFIQIVGAISIIWRLTMELSFLLCQKQWIATTTLLHMSASRLFSPKRKWFRSLQHLSSKKVALSIASHGPYFSNSLCSSTSQTSTYAEDDPVKFAGHSLGLLLLQQPFPDGNDMNGGTIAYNQNFFSNFATVSNLCHYLARPCHIFAEKY